MPLNPPAAHQKPPKPETTRAWLMSAGIPEKTYTTHHWYETRLVSVKVLKPTGEYRNEQAWEHVFKCFKTGAERRWGLAWGPGDDGGDEVAPPEVIDCPRVAPPPPRSTEASPYQGAN